MFWDKAALIYDFFEKIYNGKVYYGTGMAVAEDILYGDMHPKLLWGRTQTLGKGGSCCDFKISVKR